MASDWEKAENPKVSESEAMRSQVKISKDYIYIGLLALCPAGCKTLTIE